MPIKPKGEESTAPKRTRAAPPQEEATEQVVEQTGTETGSAEEEQHEVKDTIVHPRSRPRIAPAPTEAAAEGTDDPDNWAHAGDSAEAIAAAEIARREAAREERAARGYWPRKFSLIPPGTMSRKGPINDKYQAQFIVVDEKFAYSLYLHLMKNPRTGRLDVYEPCPKEFDSCPLCPPVGQFDSRFTGLLTVLNISGFTKQDGTFVPVSQELLHVEPAEQAFFYELLKEKGSLRGLGLTATRMSKNDPDIGKLSEPVWYSEDAIKNFLATNGMLNKKQTQEGEIIDAREDWMMYPVNYKSFLHRPSGADLRARYQNGANAPLGAQTGADGNQWGNSRYEPGAASPPAGGWGETVGGQADLSDDLPF